LSDFLSGSQHSGMAEGEAAAASPDQHSGMAEGEAAAASLDTVLMDEAEILACSFDSWYEEFRDQTFRSRIIRLPEDFVQYLMADGIQLPGTSSRESGRTGDDNDDDDDSEWGDGGSDSEAGDGGSVSSRAAKAPSFPDLQEQINEAIKELGGSALPKLNWSAPKDARWVMGWLKCESALEVFTLLKASDFVVHDLCRAFDDCGAIDRRRPDEFVLVLRRWYDLDESGEFRCFVQDGRLLAVSQRHPSIYFPHLSKPEERAKVTHQVTAFFQKHIRHRFTSTRYAFDVFIGKPPKMKVSLMDFSPWGPSTDALLFDWEELTELHAKAAEEGAVPSEPAFRAVQSERERLGRLENFHAVPLEVAELSLRGTEELDELCRQAQAGIKEQNQH